MVHKVFLSIDCSRKVGIFCCLACKWFRTRENKPMLTSLKVFYWFKNCLLFLSFAFQLSFLKPPEVLHTDFLTYINLHFCLHRVYEIATKKNYNFAKIF